MRGQLLIVSSAVPRACKRVDIRLPEWLILEGSRVPFQILGLDVELLRGPVATERMCLPAPRTRSLRSHLLTPQKDETRAVGRVGLTDYGHTSSRSVRGVSSPTPG